MKRTLPIILMTAFGTTLTAIESMKRGAFDYLAKPFDPDELLLSLKKALEYENLLIFCHKFMDLTCLEIAYYGAHRKIDDNISTTMTRHTLACTRLSVACLEFFLAPIPSQEVDISDSTDIYITTITAVATRGARVLLTFEVEPAHDTIAALPCAGS